MFTVYVQPVNGFDSSVAVSLSGLPTGVSASPSSFSLQGPATQVVTLTAATSAATVSNATINVVGSSGSLTSNTSLSLNILGPPGFSISVPSTISVIAGASQTSTVSVTGINGFSGMVTINISGLPAGVTASPSPPIYVTPGYGTQLTLTAATSASGSSIVTFSGTSGSLSAQAQATVTVSTSPDFEITTGIYTGLPINAGSSGTFEVSVTGYNGFNALAAVLISGLPSGVTASPASFSILPGQSQPVTVTVPLTAAVSQTNFTVQGTSGTLVHQTQVQLDIMSPYLNLEAQPTSITIPAGSASQVLLTVNVAPNSTGAIPVAISGLPAGVTASPSNLNVLAPGGSTEVYFQAASSGAKAGTVTLTGTYGSIKQTATVAITIGPAQIDTAVPIKSRSKYVRSDSTFEYGNFPPPNWSVYDSSTQQFFASDPGTNHLNVFDATTEKLVATLVVPGAFGIDLAPDNSALYVGTLSGDLYVVDPVNLVVTRRYPSETISDYGFSANAVFALANGKLLLEQYFLIPGYSWVDGNGPLALWNPADNSIVKFLDPDGFDGLMPEQGTCLQNFEFGVLTNNRTRILLTPVITGAGSSILCSFDPNADTWVWSPTITDGDGGALETLAVSPDGNTVAAFDGAKIYVLNAATLQVKNSFAVPFSQGLIGYPSMVIGSDNQTAYINGMSGILEDQLIAAYNLATGALVGWMPQIQVAGEVPYMQGISSNGLIGGVVEQGFGFLDASALNPLPVGSPFGPGNPAPAYGPSTGGTTTSWPTGLPNGTTPPMGSVYFGTTAATGVSVSAGTIYATTPSGSPGPADVITTTTDGGEQIMPEAFSYGPSVLEAPTSYATAEGGGPAQVYGYGFGPSYPSNEIVAPPSDLGVQLGSYNAQLTGYLPGPYAMEGFEPQPFPLVGAEFTVPPGSAGTSVNLTVSNSSGSTTVANGFTYLPQIQVFPIDGQLIDGVYDSVRDVYYFTDATQIRVFSRAEAKWLNSIPILSPFGAPASERLYGIAMSPDQSKIVVSDAGENVLYLIDPANPSSIKNYPFTSPFPTIEAYTPSGVAITNSGEMYFAHDQQYGRLPLSADGTKIYFNNGGGIGYLDITAPAGEGLSAPMVTIDPGTGQASTVNSGATNCTPCTRLDQGGFDVVLAANQTSVYADGLMTGSSLNIEGFQALNWRESFDADYVYGAAISPDGSLLFQPGAQSIDIFDGRTGAFRARVSLSVPLSPNYRALIGDGEDNILVAITGDTGDGIAVIDLSSIPEPNPLPYAHLSPPAKFNVAHTSPSATPDSRSASPSEALVPPFASPRTRIQHRTRKFVSPRLRPPYVSAGAQLSQ